MFHIHLCEIPKYCKWGTWSENQRQDASEQVGLWSGFTTPVVFRSHPTNGTNLQTFLRFPCDLSLPRLEKRHHGDLTSDLFTVSLEAFLPCI